MIYLKLQEIQEFDRGENVEPINEALRSGWVYLGLRIKRRKVSEFEFDEYAVYILGLPVDERAS